MLFVTVWTTLALQVVRGMVLNHHARRHDSLEREVEDSRRRTLEALYRWSEKKGFSKERIGNGTQLDIRATLRPDYYAGQTLSVDVDCP